MNISKTVFFFINPLRVLIVNSQFYTQGVRNLGKKVPLTITEGEFLRKEFIFTNHFLKQWNKRVFKIKSKKKLMEYIKNTTKQDGLWHQYRDFYLLGDNIILVLKRDGDKIIFITTYGKVSENPILNNIKQFFLWAKNKDRVQLY